MGPVARQSAHTDGIALTSAGYLKPVDVVACVADLNLSDEWIGTPNRESQTYPVLHLRESVLKLGLLRKVHGKLLVTATGRKVSKDPVALWRHIASRVPFGDGSEQDAGRVALLLVAAGRSPVRETIHRALVALGWGYSPTEPITLVGASHAAHSTFGVLEGLGAVPRSWPQRPAQHIEGGAAFSRAALGAGGATR